MLFTRVTPLLAAVAAVGCSPFDPDLGPQPFLCGDREPRCPDGYVCIERVGNDNVCLSHDIVADAGGDARLQCSADTLEPNETIDDASPVEIPGTGGTDTFDAVICPVTDLDIYRLEVGTTGENIRAELDYPSAAGELVVELLNSTGVSIRTGTPTNNDRDKLRADFTNLALGTYYGRVKGTGSLNNYQITFIITSDPLPP